MNRFSFLLAASFLAVSTAGVAEPISPSPTPANSVPAIRQFAIEGNTLLPTDRLMDALAPYLGTTQPADALAQAGDAVRRLYRDAGYEMVSVALQAPTGADGVARLRVHETRIGQVSVTGNTHFSTAGLRDALPALKENESPDFRLLARQLFLANDNPARQVALQFTPGADGTADAIVKVEEGRPLRFAVSADNTGTEATGRSRATAMVSHANLWDAGHEFVGSYTTSPEKPGQVRQLSTSYQVPVTRWGDRLQLTYNYSNTDAGRVADTFNVSGQGSTFGLRFLHFLERTADGRQVIEAGIDDKRYRNTIDFFGSNLGVDVSARPLTLGYQYAQRSGPANISALLGYSRNLPGGHRNDDLTYGASRSGASAGWSLWRTGVDLTLTAHSQWALHSAFEAQYTARPLISSEQFGLGGARSVRGFLERETSGDRGWRLSNEVVTPALAGQHRLLAFVDGGRENRLQALPGESAGATLLSAGFGWRWQATPSLYSSLDWARVFKGTERAPAGHQALHFTAVWRFV
jgi:hemolysin activation/secretion protein